MGFLPQEPSIFRKLTVEENVLAILEARGMPAAARQERAQALLCDLNISHLANSRAYTLSGGERRRAEITRTLATDPAFILLTNHLPGSIRSPSTTSGHHRPTKDRGIGANHRSQRARDLADRRPSHIITREDSGVGTAAELASDERARQIYLGERFSL
jgi:lipopolysaccharide export system ATP-binding protein